MNGKKCSKKMMKDRGGLAEAVKPVARFSRDAGRAVAKKISPALKAAKVGLRTAKNVGSMIGSVARAAAPRSKAQVQARKSFGKYKSR